LARELVNRIQNLRKESGFDVTDKINIYIEKNPELSETIDVYGNYICSQTLGSSINIIEKMEHNSAKLVEVDNFETLIWVERI
ncbi:MAG TPA: DUF5915 domain-containing protein, partial [Bacteroidales bacterium]|nr:DUF5915 domain-containing protein [Bacteroidales bacterium]